MDALLSGPVAVDANALDASGRDGDHLVDRLLALASGGTVKVVVAGGVRDEALHPSTPAGVRDTLLSLASLPRATTTHARTLGRIRVRAILRGDAAFDKHEADARHLSEAAEAGCAVFVTHDRRILRRRADLRAVLPALRIMTLERFIAWIDDGANEDGDDRQDER